MSYPNLPAAASNSSGFNPARAGWDVAVSIVLLVVNAAGWVAATGVQFLMLAFTDYCPPERCSEQRAIASLVVSVSTAAASAVIGGIITVIRIIQRRPAWRYAAAALALSTVAEVLGFVGYVAAVGY
jgi:hypothetical protein